MPKWPLEAQLCCASSSTRLMYTPCFQILVDNGLAKTKKLEVLDLRANRLSPMCARHLARLMHETRAVISVALFRDVKGHYAVEVV